MTPVFISPDNDIKLVFEAVVNELDKLQVWFSVNGLSLSKAKTKYMIILPKSKRASI